MPKGIYLHRKRKHYTIKDTSKMKGGNSKGKHWKLTEKTKRKMSKSAKKGNKHHNWKGDNIGYGQLHKWLRKRLLKPKKCENCRKKEPYDLANKSGKYKRNFKNWWWLCRSCHMELDGRINNNLKQYKK